MRYLIDTNILIRLVNEQDAISEDVWSILNDTDNTFYISTMSIQEIFMLMQAGKLNVKQWNKPADIFNYIEYEFYCSIKYVQKEHLLTFANFTPAENHGDPFDRMIIAQAITEQIPLISSDKKFHQYRKQNLKFIFNEMI
ncbi:MAG: type II toxin-antitoxin system VapC family toxin [Prevotellaceae bacterium]|jgi:PIN domain nuclease of toxin-antitoxin system|nr:type II toxin-antitoxin system VapC family toxin [Prevotellaceae bacterium]